MDKPIAAVASLLIVSALSLSKAQAAPSVSAVQGTVANGQQITITGAGFGNGPHVLIYDDFEKGDGKIGAAIPLSSPEVGQWSQYGQANGRPRYSSYANSGTHSWRISDPAFDPNNDNDSDRLAQFRQLFATPVQQFFISYEVAVPPGTTFPGASSVDQFPSVSSWKFVWIFDGPRGFGADGLADMCLPTQVGYGDFQYDGNDGFIVNLKNSWWSWKGFNHISAWLRASPTDPSGSGDVLFQAVNAEKGMTTISLQHTVFPNNSSTQWDRFTMPGWWGNGDNTNNQAVYDDVYVAAGPNAAARVEIGDAPTYSASKNLTILTPDSWSSTQITATVRAGSFSSFDGAYLYVVDSNDNVSAAYPLGVRPQPPSNVAVN